MKETTEKNVWQGERVRLRAIEPEDAPVFYAWNLDSEVGRLTHFVWPPQSLVAVKEWAQREAARRPENDQFHFVIENREGELVGTISSHHTDRRTGVFQYGLAVRREFRRRGFASDAILTLLRYFFDELRYQKVNATVYANNEASYALHERLGFVHEGTLRRTVYTEGRHYDEHVFGMTVEEFHELHKDREPNHV